MGTITVRRHEYMLEPGEGVITTPDLALLASRTEEFIGDTAIDPRELIVNPVVGIPLPVTLFSDGARVRPQVSPDMMWHPLFWLPLDVGLRRVIPGDPQAGDADRPESDAEWAIRIMTMIGAAALFEPDSATWVDVLSMVGLDGDDEVVGERVAAWQAGGDDPVLDGIDLTELFESAEAEAAAEAVLELTPDLIAAQYAISADDIGESITGVINDDTLDAEDLKGAAYLYLVQAHQALFDDPDVDSIPKVQTRIGDLIRQLQTLDVGGGDVDAAGILKDLRAIMAQVFLTFEPFLAVIGHLAGAMEDESDEGEDEDEVDEVAADPASIPSDEDDWGSPPALPVQPVEGISGW